MERRWAVDTKQDKQLTPQQAADLKRLFELAKNDSKTAEKIKVLSQIDEYRALSKSDKREVKCILNANSIG